MKELAKPIILPQKKKKTKTHCSCVLYIFTGLFRKKSSAVSLQSRAENLERLSIVGFIVLKRKEMDRHWSLCVLEANSPHSSQTSSNRVKIKP